METTTPPATSPVTPVTEYPAGVSPVVNPGNPPTAAPVSTAPVIAPENPMPSYESGGNVGSKTNWLVIGAGVVLLVGFAVAIHYYRVKITQIIPKEKEQEDFNKKMESRVVKMENYYKEAI